MVARLIWEKIEEIEQPTTICHGIVVVFFFFLSPFCQTHPERRKYLHALLNIEHIILKEKSWEQREIEREKKWERNGSISFFSNMSCQSL